MKTNKLVELVMTTLEAYKSKHITQLDVKDSCQFTDVMIIATGTSKRHVHTLAEQLVQKAKAANHPPLGVEGEEYNEWILIDLGDVVVHIMRQEVRDFYQLEKLWSPQDSE